MTPARRALLADGPPGESAAERRHRTLTELKRTVRHHPAVDIVTGAAGGDGRFRALTVAFDPLILGVDADRAALRIEWRPRPDPTEPVYFVFHYDDSTGRDFGWHREPNPHVDGLEHFQARTDPDQEYDYQPTYFDSTSPVNLLWDVLGRIEKQVADVS
jgi:hypothetical protein